MIGGAISLFRSRKQPDPTDQKRAFIATGLGMLLVAIVFIAGTGGADAPPINDISTDLVDPPAFASAEVVTDYAGRDMTYPADFVPIVETAYPDLQPIQVATEPGEAYSEMTRFGKKSIARESEDWAANVGRLTSSSREIDMAHRY